MADYTDTIARLRTNANPKAHAMAFLIENGLLTALEKTIADCKANDIQAIDYLHAFIELTACETVAFISCYPDERAVKRLAIDALKTYANEIERSLSRARDLKAEQEQETMQ